MYYCILHICIILVTSRWARHTQDTGHRRGSNIGLFWAACCLLLGNTGFWVKSVAEEFAFSHFLKNISLQNRTDPKTGSSFIYFICFKYSSRILLRTKNWPLLFICRDTFLDYHEDSRVGEIYFLFWRFLCSDLTVCVTVNDSTTVLCSSQSRREQCKGHLTVWSFVPQFGLSLDKVSLSHRSHNWPPPCLGVKCQHKAKQSPKKVKAIH